MSPSEGVADNVVSDLMQEVQLEREGLVIDEMRSTPPNLYRSIDAASDAVLDAPAWSGDERAALVQLAAIAIAWVEFIDRKAAR